MGGDDEENSGAAKPAPTDVAEWKMMSLVSQGMQRQKDKGLAVVKQLEIYSKLIELHLVLFEGINLANRLPIRLGNKDTGVSDDKTKNHQVEIVNAEIDNLLTVLIDLKYTLSSLNEKIPIKDSNCENEGETQEGSRLDALDDVERMQETWLESCIRQSWEESVISRLGSSALGLTSIKGDTYTAIQQALSSDMKQMIEESRVPVKRDDTPTEPQQGSNEIKTYPETFDDTTTYNQLARTLLELQKYVSDNLGTINITNLANNLTKKHKRKSVGTRTNKQKKIKFEFHEKLCNFTAPREREGLRLDADSMNNILRSLFVS